MRVLLLGCGEMGRVALEDLLMQRAFDEVTVATRSPAKARDVLDSLPSDGPTSVEVREVDVRDGEALSALMRGHAAVCNLTGPNHLNGVPVARAAIRAGVPLVDACDVWETTLALLDLHGAAEAAGVTLVIGMGASPGATNVMARAGANRLDRTDEVRTAWVMRGSDLGGPALARHLLHDLPHRAFVYRDGEMREVVPFRDGREVVEFPEIGPVEVHHIGHPEPLTLSRFLPGIRYADDRAAFLPSRVSEWIVRLGGALRSGEAVEMGGEVLDSLEAAADWLLRACRAMTPEPTTAALRAEVRGELDGRPTRIIYEAAGRIGIGTGVPAAIVTRMLATGELHRPGVWPPEAAVDVQEFFDEVLNRRVARVHERVIRA